MNNTTKRVSDIEFDKCCDEVLNIVWGTAWDFKLNSRIDNFYVLESLHCIAKSRKKALYLPFKIRNVFICIEK